MSLEQIRRSEIAENEQITVTSSGSDGTETTELVWHPDDSVVPFEIPTGYVMPPGRLKRWWGKLFSLSHPGDRQLRPAACRKRLDGASRHGMRPSLRCIRAGPRMHPTAPIPRMLQFGGDARSKIAASSFSGLFTRVEIGHIVIGSAGKGTSKSRGSGSRGDSQRS